MRETFFEYVRIAMLFTGAVALVHFVGGFKGPQAILLGGAFAIIAVWLHNLRQTLAAFKPYRITIGIDYEALWEDLKLIPAAEPKFENFHFTAITPAVFARSDESEYSQLLTLYKQVPCGADTWLAGPGEFRSGPSFFFRPGRNGYQFGLHVQAEWWEHHRQQLTQALSNHALEYGNDLVLGVLPYGYIPEHVRRWNEPVSLWHPFDRKQRRWKKTLTQHGWSFNDDDPLYIRHRYSGIQYSDI